MHLLSTGSLVFTAGYLLAVGWLVAADLPTEHFFRGTWLQLPYTVARGVFVAYLGWLLYAAGAPLLERLERGAPLELDALGRFATACLLGTAAIHLVMYGLGLLHLYYRVPLIGVTALLVLASYRRLPPLLARAGAASAAWAEASAPARAGWLLLFAALGGSALGLFLAKVAFPELSYDGINHYLPYYEAVVESRGIGPNEVWYHYYHSKGSGLIFLAILLTDRLGAQLASATHVFLTAALVVSLARRATSSWHWSLLGACAFLAGLIDTRGWGYFEKQHVITTTLLVGLVWLSAQLESEERRPQLRVWTWLACLLAFQTATYVTTALPLVLGMFGILGLRALWQGRARLWRAYVAAGGSAVLATALVLSLSQLQTGMADLVPFRFFWQLADQHKFSEWVSPYLMVLADLGSSPGMGTLDVLDVDSPLRYWTGAFRLDEAPTLLPHPVLLPLLVAVAWVASASRTLERQARRSALWPCAALGIAAFVLGHTISQSDSMLRFFAFLLPLLCVVLVIVWYEISNLLPPAARRRLDLALPAVAAALGLILGFGELSGRKTRAVLSFPYGGTSLWQASQRSWGHWEAAEAVASLPQAPRRVWSLNGWGSLAPGIRLESLFSFSLGPRWHEAVFESPPLAREVLREEGLEHFAIDLDDRIFDLFQHSPLLHPDRIADSMGVVWNEGDSWLLTFQGPDTRPLPESFLRAYRAKLQEPGAADWAGMYEHLESIYRTHGDRYPIDRDRSRPALRGWQ